MDISSSPSPVSTPAAATAYDQAPYPSASFPESHPDKLCAMGRLFGVQAAAPATARVLELGCADGANLLPMAQHAPRARFLGIDASSRQIAEGQAAKAAAALTNIELRHQNILDFPAGEGKFDYIIAHGIFSWVPAPVRDKILEICRDHLSENGIAYISYNAFPGWGMRMALRDMLMFHTVNFPDAKAKVAQARALLTFLAESAPTKDNPHSLLLKQELERMSSQPDGYIRHDILGESNQPFYFHQFVHQAMGAGLQYLSETSLDQMLASNFPEKVAKTLDQIAGNIIAKEQYMDFVRNRNFRRTLLCHKNVPLTRSLTPESIKAFYYTSVIAQSESGAPDLKGGVAHSFKLRTGGDIALTTENSFLKAIFSVLGESGLRRISFTELLEAARIRSAPFTGGAVLPDQIAAEEASLATNLFQLYVRGIVEIYADRPLIGTSVPEKPAVTPLVRYQALHSDRVVNRMHNVVPVDAFGRFVLAACDGQKDVSGIVEELVTIVKAGKLRLTENEQPVQDEARIRLILTDRIRRVLEQTTALGFFAE